MIFEGEFFSGGHLRWNLGWPTPNYAGAFLVTLLALVFVFSESRWRWTFLALEAGGFFLLAKTYSRGAVVAWVAAWLFGVVVSRRREDPAQRLIWAARIGALAVMLLMVGFGWSRAKERTAGPQDDGTADKRATASEVPSTEDGSVVNRLALWQGGLQMIAVAPLTGWGAGESGRAYMNWYQEGDRNEGYTTMVNSYLHVAVEHGLLVLVVALWIGVWLLLVAWSGARDDATANSGELGITRPTLMMAAGASLLAWMVANIFTTLWIEPKLWIVPTLVGLSLFSRAWRLELRRLAPLTVGSLGIALLAAGGLYGIGRWLSRKQSLEIASCVDGMVIAGSKIPGQTEKTWHVWSDTAVAGRTPGKEMRRWLLAQPPGIRLISHSVAPMRANEPRLEADGVMLFGRQVERIGHGFAPECHELWLIHPMVSPPIGRIFSMKDATITVLLPQIDETGNGQAWRRWAAQYGARVVKSPGSGLDIRSVWPGVLALDANRPLAKGPRTTAEPSTASREHL